MLTTTLLAFAIGFAGPTPPPLSCPATLESIPGKPAVTLEYAGAKFGTCCGGCDKPFAAKPADLLAKAIAAKKTIGAFDYDAVTGARIDAKSAKAWSDYKAIRYYFASDAEKKSFDAAPTSFVTAVKTEAYFCPVMKHVTASKDAGAFADYNGTRYYLCCGDCLAEFKKDPAKFTAAAASAIKPLAVVTVK